jgi:hypothetical protein
VVVTNILETKPSKPISVIIELAQIQKHCKVGDVIPFPINAAHLSLPRKN